MNNIQVVRAFWGSLETYKPQIEKAPRYDEETIVWGKDNFEYLVNRGYKCILVSDDPYDYTIAAAHTFIDHSSLIHKLKAIDIAVDKFKEIVFLDWDCYNVKNLDSSFYSTFKEGNELQVPLYVYPKSALDKLVKSDIDIEYYNFFSKLADYLEEHAYKLDDDFIIPNTGFIYCRSKTVTEKLLDIAIKNNLQTVPDELAVLYYAKELNLDLDGFIDTFEPSVINGKYQDNPEWIDSQTKLDNYIKSKVAKNIFFHHV